MISKHINDLTVVWGKKYFLKKLEKLSPNNACEEAQCVTLIQGAAGLKWGGAQSLVHSPLLSLLFSGAWGHFCGTLYGQKILLSKDQKKSILAVTVCLFC